MQNYPQRVAENILPLSMSGSLPEAFKEWFFSDKIYDHEKAEEMCELCNQENVRYHFQIVNQHTKKTLWVGSSCILRFNLAVYDQGKILDEKNAKKKLNTLVTKMQMESCIKALEVLAKSENNDILKNALLFYKKYKNLTPKLAFVVFWKLKEKNIDHHPSFFKINLKKDQYKQDLRDMPIKRIHIIWPALSSSQKDIATRLGHHAPK